MCVRLKSVVYSGDALCVRSILVCLFTSLSVGVVLLMVFDYFHTASVYTGTGRFSEVGQKDRDFDSQYADISEMALEIP